MCVCVCFFRALAHLIGNLWFGPKYRQGEELEEGAEQGLRRSSAKFATFLIIALICCHFRVCLSVCVF